MPVGENKGGNVVLLLVFHQEAGGAWNAVPSWNDHRCQCWWSELQHDCLVL